MLIMIIISFHFPLLTLSPMRAPLGRMPFPFLGVVGLNLHCTFMLSWYITNTNACVSPSGTDLIELG